MQDLWPPLIAALRMDLGQVQRAAVPGPDQTEACFKICLHHWTLLRELARRQDFEDDAAEIHFFKEVKPLYTGLLEFYHLVYFHQLFCPGGGPADIAEFQRNERSKIERFRDAHAGFIAYYEAGATDQDATYFLRRHRPEEPPPYVRVYDMDPAFLTAADWIVTLYIGYGRYDGYLGKR
jgi:RteC protein